MAGVTLRQIAEKVGCSRSTVSYALKNDPNISAALRAKVVEAARELGWKPDAKLARQMALVRRTATDHDPPKLAIVINKSHERLRREVTPRMQLRGATVYAEAMGYSPDLFNLEEQPLSPKRLRDILRARGVEGVVFIATVDPELSREHLEVGREFACAVAGVRYAEVPFHVVINDFLSAGRLIILKLLEAGFERPAVVLPRGLDRPLGYGFTGGIWTGLMDVPMEHRLPILHLGSDECYLPEYEFDRAVEWLLRNRPDAVISTDVRAMEEILSTVAMHGLRLPLYSSDYHPDQKAVRGGIDARQEHVGRAAVDVVVAQLHRGETGLPEVQRVLQVEGIWREASSGAGPSEDERIAALGRCLESVK
jgi:LacI family transcriptional regulator